MIARNRMRIIFYRKDGLVVKISVKYGDNNQSQFHTFKQGRYSGGGTQLWSYMRNYMGERTYG